MTLIRDLGGRLVPLGRVEQEFTWSPAFSGTGATGTLSSQISAAIGTTTARTTGGNSGAAHVEVMSASAGGALRHIFTTPIIPQHYDEIEFTLDGLRFGANAGFNFRMEIGETGQDRGISLRHANSGTTESYATIRGHTSSGVFEDFATNYQLQKPNGGSTKPRSVTVRWRPNDQEVYVLEGDQVMASADIGASAAITSACRCLFTLEVTDATVHYLYWSKWTTKVRHN